MSKEDEEASGLVAVSGDDGSVAGEVVSDRQEEAERIRKRIIELRTQLTENYFEMGAHLYRVQKEALYTFYIGPSGEPYKRFEDYVEHEVDFAFRKAKYLMSIWWWFAHEVADPNVFEKVKSVGWQKAAYLAQIVDSKNVDAWVDKAKKMSIRDLNAETREAIKGAGYKNRQQLRDRSGNVSIKEQPETTPSGDPSTHGAPLPTPTPMSGAPEQQRLGIDPLDEDEARDARRPWGAMLTASQKENVDAALDLAANIADVASDGKGYLLDFMATSFMAMNAATVAKKADRPDAFRDEMLRAVERVLKVDLVAFDNDKMRVVYGDEVIDRLSQEDADAGES